VKHAYGGRTVLSIEHLTFAKASIVGLRGPNGSGKSTLLRLLGLIEKPAEGEILFNGRPAEPFSAEARFRVSLLPQEPFLMKRRVLGNVSYGIKIRGAVADVTGRVHEALSLVGLSDRDFVRRPWYALSGGEAQRVALAARLALRPDVLLLDEPTANVDTSSAELIREAAFKAREEMGTTLVIASHDWQWLYEVCDRVLHLFNGKILGTGRENILFGPWIRFQSGLWGKRLRDQEFIVPSPPPCNDAAAIMDVSSIGENSARVDEDDVVLKGNVIRLNLERNTGTLVATIAIGNQNFIVGLTPRQAEDRAFLPGKDIFIHYYPNKIRWI
jgi:tungstate transport system ATP-binding protein